jgi:hypothetical protein
MADALRVNPAIERSLSGLRRWSPQIAAGKEACMRKGPIRLTLEVEPLKLTMRERENFRISLSATNDGAEVIDPHLHHAKLFVNEEESKAWSLAIGNGKREAKWFALRPGETVSMTWSSMGDSLFTHPGVFTLALRFDEMRLAPIQVQVLAE